MSLSETAIMIPGPVGVLESLIYPVKNSDAVAVICHPHPLFQGTMYNKVIYILSRIFHDAGITAVRFNFRGVGKSEGSFGHSVGEIEDLFAVVNWIKETTSSVQFYFAGFSFGAYIAASGAAGQSCKQLFSIAPAVTHQPYASLPSLSNPWLVLQGEEDEIISPQAVYDWYEDAKNYHHELSLIKLPGATHFFHGQLNTLRAVIKEHLVK